MNIKKTVLTPLLLLIAFGTFAQTLSITSPTLVEPYEVAKGTAVTFEWDAYGVAPGAIYTYDEEPSFYSFMSPSSDWTAHTNFTENTDGTYSIVLSITEDTWVFGGFNAGFSGWLFSNVIDIASISSYSISADKNIICSTNDSAMFIAPDSIGFTHQWYNGSVSISGATEDIYYATAPGSYYCNITKNSSVYKTNTIAISEYSISYTAVLGDNDVVLTAGETFASYQWFERTATGSLTAITGATSNTYTAPITTTLKYYLVEAYTANGCTSQSLERPVVDSLLATPVATLYTEANGSGKVCAGTPVSIAVDDKISDIRWYKNGSFQNTTDSINLSGSYQNGTWYAEAVNDYWPEITRVSNSVVVNITSLITPDVTGDNYYDFFCTGATIDMILTDEGYNYTWYLHDTVDTYGSSNVISVPNGYYQHNFTHTTNVTIVGEFDGCSTSRSYTLESYLENDLDIKISNYDQEYLCTDSLIEIFVNYSDTSDYSNYQWYKMDNGSWTILTGETGNSYMASEANDYMLTATINDCPTLTDTSDIITINSYLDRAPNIYTLQSTICEGDTTEIKMTTPDNWYAMQWLSSDISVGAGEYTRNYVGMITNSGADTQLVTTYDSYMVSAKHVSCPNGSKVRSNIVFITPTLHPKVILTQPLETQERHIVDWDSTDHVIGCDNDSAYMTLDDTDWSSIEWYWTSYEGDDDYILGEVFATGNEAKRQLTAEWITAIVTNSEGCVGSSTPYLIDSYEFADPVVAYSNNAELCDEEDSVHLQLGFAGGWDRYEWTKDAVPMPNSDTFEIYAYVPGVYVINAYPTLCPDIMYSSGLGAQVKYLYSAILENDEEIYAVPQLGFYTYQWYLDGEPIESASTTTPWTYPKSDLVNGVYTVEVSNYSCTIMSSSFVWTSTGIEDVIKSNVKVYPNPVNDKLFIEFEDNSKVVTDVTISNMSGSTVYQSNTLNSNYISTDNLATGMYIVRITTEEGHIHIMKISKN